MPKKNILLAMFDIKPMSKSASFVLSKIKAELDLHIENKSECVEQRALPKTIIERPVQLLPDEDYWEELVAKLPQRPGFVVSEVTKKFSKATILKELEKVIQEQVDVAVELASVGGMIHERVVPNPIAEVIEPVLTSIESEPANKKLKNFWLPVPAVEAPVELPAQAGLVVDNHNHSPASREIEILLENIQKNRNLLAPSQVRLEKRPQTIFRNKTKWSSWLRFNRKAMVYFLAVTFSGMALWGLVGHQGIVAKNNIVQNGNNAVANLEDAKRNLENLNFVKAADSFALAYDDLNKASGTLSQFGASFLSAFGNLPGLSKVKAANNLVEAGQSLSKAGENLSLAFGSLYKTNLLAALDVGGGGPAGKPSMSKLLGEFRDILSFADKNVTQANHLLADIDISAIPTEKQQLFLNFKEKIPEFQQYIGQAVDYSDFLLKFVGSDSPKTYLVLLQNNSELRPTGGFPGSYALITFDNGSLKKVFIDDIYRADAGIKDNIIPPIQMQHITPNWGMRDAGWFADFPFSAKKFIQLYQLGGGPKVDGVLTITPDIIAKIFNVIGSIEMPEYGLTLNSDNLLAALQNEIEYKADRSAPKQILSDLQPKFFERLGQQDKDHWLAIFKIISQAAEQKHILAYFADQDLQRAAIKNGLAGEIKSSLTDSGQPADYLQVVFANVKGSKTDFVTENTMNLETEVSDGGVVSHTLAISRVHNGGNSKYGFYNRDNPAYIKVYVPQGSTLSGIQGQSITDFRPLISYGDFGFKTDPDLEQIEATFKRPFAGVDVFEESGRTVFGFWLVLKPKQAKTVKITYQTPVSSGAGHYGLMWQKQSGTNQDQIGFSFKVPDDKKIMSQNAGAEIIGNSVVVNSDLAEDRVVDLVFR